MPNGQAGRTAWTDAFRGVRVWLRETCEGAVRTLTKAELDRYSAHSIRHGWGVMVAINGQDYRLFVLLPAGFPYAHPRIALASENRLLSWPHVQDLGLLCLPMQPASDERPVDTVKDALADACALIEECIQGDTNDVEFRREFLSYWSRHAKDGRRPVRSLLTPGFRVRQIAVWRGTTCDIVGETGDGIVRWLKHVGNTVPAGGFTTYQGLLVPLSQPPIPRDFPSTITGLKNWLEHDAPGAFDMIVPLSDMQDRVLVVLEASTTGFAQLGEDGSGFMAVGINGASKVKVNGFRLDKAPRELRRNRWLADATLSAHNVERIDAAWVHGRGRDSAQPVLYSKTICILGCGAIGSQIAIRLAQAGVGSLILVDPESLEAANVGRHALGMSAVGCEKAPQLAKEIARRFPHIQNVEGLPRSWVELSVEERDRIASSDLIISAIGDWSAEGLVNAWHIAREATPPIVYAWLEEHGVAGHGLAICKSPGCLRCLLHGDGSVITPETTWPEGSMLRSEPACGTMYQPFGPVELGYSEALITDLCLDMLLGKIVRNTHRIYATSTERLATLGGSWTPEHLHVRPVDFDGPLLTDRLFEPRPDCPVCSNG